MKNPMHIRPHHAVCAQFFVGKGYSAAFVDHMYRILAALDCDGAVVTLTDGCDAICSACPENRDGVCRSEQKVHSIDRRAIEAMGCRFGDTLPWQTLTALARDNIITPQKLLEICRDCEWIGICSKA